MHELQQKIALKFVSSVAKYPSCSAFSHFILKTSIFAPYCIVPPQDPLQSPDLILDSGKPHPCPPPDLLQSPGEILRPEAELLHQLGLQLRPLLLLRPLRCAGRGNI